MRWNADDEKVITESASYSIPQEGVNQEDAAVIVKRPGQPDGQQDAETEVKAVRREREDRSGSVVVVIAFLLQVRCDLNVFNLVVRR